MLGVAARGPKWLFERQACTKIVQDSLVREDVLLVDGAFCCCKQQNDCEASLLDGEALLVAHGVAAFCGRRQAPHEGQAHTRLRKDSLLHVGALAFVHVGKLQSRSKS